MKKESVLYAGLVLALLQSVCFAAYPPKTGLYVSDYAGVLSKSVKERVNEKLADYEKRTTNQFIVVLPKSLDGMDIENWTIGLGEAWGVGRKGKDNGVVFVIAPKERELRFEVGYGLEGVLTDRKCGEIRNNYAYPYLKNNRNDWDSAVEKTVDAVMAAIPADMFLETKSNLPPAAVEEPAQTLKTSQALVQKQRQENYSPVNQGDSSTGSSSNAGTYLFVIVVLLAAVGGIGGLAFAAMSLQRRKKLRILAREELGQAKAFGQRLSSKIVAVREKAKSFPRWAADEAGSKLSEAESILLQSPSLLLQAEGMIKTDVDKAASVVSKLKRNVLNKVDSLIRAAEIDIPVEIEGYKREAPNKVGEARKEVDAAKNKIERFVQDGFIFTKITNGINAVEREVANLEEQIKEDIHDDKRIYDSAQNLCNSIFAITKPAEDIVDLKGKNKEDITRILREISEVEGSVGEPESILNGLMRICPPENWKDLAGDFAKVAGLLLTARPFVSSAKEKNSMEKQDFGGAANDLSSADKNIASVKKTLGDIAKRDREIKEARQNYLSKIGDAQTNVRSALNRVRNSDVGRTAREKADESNTKLAKAQSTAAGAGLVNWLAAYSLLATAVELSQTAVSRANLDISSAEASRIAEEKRRAEEEERRREESYHSSYSPPSFHSGGGSVFHGGGGHFGGGGASGRF